jgi:hypothetical protein
MAAHEGMTQHVARAICWSATHPFGQNDKAACRHCKAATPADCKQFEAFRPEAEAAVLAVRDYALLTLRNKPRI